MGLLRVSRLVTRDAQLSEVLACSEGGKAPKEPPDYQHRLFTVSLEGKAKTCV